MSWKRMDTAPKDGTVIVVYADLTTNTEKMLPDDVFFAFYQEREGHWDALLEDIPFRTPIIREQATLLGWTEVPKNSSLAGMKAYRGGELTKEPGKLHLYKSSHS